MANIIRQGKTPKWGVGSHNIEGAIIDSYNQGIEIKDYEQTDEQGAVCGYLVYDQTITFDISGTILHNENDSSSFNSGVFTVGSTVNNFISGLTSIYGVNCSINHPTKAIVKSLSFSQSAGGAQTFSASGTIYDFTENTTSEG